MKTRGNSFNGDSRKLILVSSKSILIPNKMQHKKTDLTLCIPRVEMTIKKQQIFEAFSALKIGFIDRITEIPLRNDDTGKRILIKFRTWVETPTSIKIMARLDAGKDIKLVYSNPWYWVVTKWNDT
jgi:hypothetical protein